MDLHQMLLIHDILHCKEMSKMKDVDQNFDALDCHILREYLILLFYDQRGSIFLLSILVYLAQCIIALLPMLKIKACLPCFSIL